MDSAKALHDIVHGASLCLQNNFNMGTTISQAAQSALKGVLGF